MWMILQHQKWNGRRRSAKRYKIGRERKREAE
jgi:hypothetical protein